MKTMSGRGNFGTAHELGEKSGRGGGIGAGKWRHVGGREGGGKVSTQWKKVSGVFPHNGNVFPELFHTMEAGFGHFSTQWKYISRGFSMVWKNGGRPGLSGGQRVMGAGEKMSDGG